MTSFLLDVLAAVFAIVQMLLGVAIVVTIFACLIVVCVPTDERDDQ